MKTVITCVTVIILAGCATCERHPVACSATAAVIATSITLSLDHHRHDRDDLSFQARRPCPDSRDGGKCK